jgi:hypothetical protein
MMHKISPILSLCLLLSIAAPLMSADKDPNIVWPAQKPTRPVPIHSIAQQHPDAAIISVEQYPATIPLLLEEIRRTSIADIEQRADHVRTKSQQLTRKNDDPDFEEESWCDQRTDVFHTTYRPIFIRLEQSFDKTIKTPIALHILELVQQQEAFNAQRGVKREENKVELTFPNNQRLDDYTRYTLENNKVHCVTKITDYYLIVAAIELAKKGN